MIRVLLVSAASLAAILAAANPAGARDRDRGFSGVQTRHSGAFFGSDRCFDDRRSHRRFRDGHDGHDDGDDRDHRRRRDREINCVISGGDLGYLDYGDYDANRSFDPDLWNDWWHSRTDRSFPRWVRHNQDCTPDRMWWSGSGWHC